MLAKANGMKITNKTGNFSAEKCVKLSKLSRAQSTSYRLRSATISALAISFCASLSFAAELPSKGESKSQVQNQWGTAEQTRNAVGSPPISRWIYNDFTVYFEGRHVIHSVAHPTIVATPAAEQIPVVIEPVPEPIVEPVAEPATHETDSSDEAASAEVIESVEPIAEPIETSESEPRANSTTTSAPIVTPSPASSQETSDTVNEQEFQFDPVTGEIILMNEASKNTKEIESSIREAADSVEADNVTNLPLGSAPEIAIEEQTETSASDSDNEEDPYAEDPYAEDPYADDPYADEEAETVDESSAEVAPAKETLIEETPSEEPFTNPSSAEPTSTEPAANEISAEIDTIENNLEENIEAADESVQTVGEEVAPSTEPEFRFDPVTGQIIIVE